MSVSEWESPIPIDRPELPAFPVNRLPEPLRDWIESTAEYTQTPIELPALLALAACSGCVARRFEIDCGWIEPINLWVAILLEPANRKSKVYNLAFQPIREIERQLIDIAKPDTARQVMELTINKQRLEELKKKAARGDAEAMQEAGELAERLATSPEPVLPKLIIDDATPEAIEMILAAQGGRIIVSGAEGGIFQMMAGKTSKFTNMEVFLKGHAGDDLRVDRLSRGSVVVDKTCLTLGYAIQPEVISGLASKSTFRGCGLLARFLWAVPRSPVGKRKIETVRVSPEVEQAYRQLLEKMFQLGEQVGAQNVERLILPKHAERRFIDWREQVELWLGEGETLGSMQDWGGKLCGLTARLATVIHLAESLPQMLPSFTLAYRAWMLLSKSRNGRSRMQKRRLGCLVMMAGQ
jgi:replicative DNA helicase